MLAALCIEGGVSFRLLEIAEQIELFIRVKYVFVLSDRSHCIQRNTKVSWFLNTLV